MLLEKIEIVEKRYDDIYQMISNPDIIADQKKYIQLNKELKELSKLVETGKMYKNAVSQKLEAEEYLNSSDDEDMTLMAKEQLDLSKEAINNLEEEIKILLIPKDPEDSKNVVVEIRAGTGGMEAALFAADLFNMYQKVAVLNGWKVEIINLSNSEGGGYKEIIASIVGRNVFSKLKFESGVHRVQRVPDTETQGRVHTSAATVAVLPEAEEVDVKINDADLRIDVFRSSGPGGQSVNTTDSAVRVTHIPSGIVVSQQDEKSQHKNKAKALKILRSKLYDLQRSQQESERAKARKSQIGTGDRSERIRTYNFPQGRVTDHRINMTLYKLTDFLTGDAFKELSDAIQIQFQEEQLENLKI